MVRLSSLHAILLVALALVGQAQEQARVAVVVNPENPANDISLAMLRDYFQCEKLYWHSGQRAVVFTRQSGSLEHQVMLHVIFGMNESEYQQLWVMKQIRGENSCRLTELPSKGMVQEALRTYAGALSLVKEPDLIPGMKVVTVNGKHMQDADYPLH